MSNSTALFGISVGNRNFADDVIVNCLQKDLPKYKRIVFLIADRLQSYNYLVKRADHLALALHKLKAIESKYVDERSVWLSRIRKKIALSVPDQEWKIVSIDSVADYHYASAHRNVAIFYDLDDAFRSDIEVEVEIAYSRRLAAGASRGSETGWRRVSTRYLLEEIALNMIVRCRFGIEDEYYAGGYMPSAVGKMIRGEYSVSMYDLLGVDKPKQSSPNLYLWRNNEWVSNSLLSDDERLAMGIPSRSL